MFATYNVYRTHAGYRPLRLFINVRFWNPGLTCLTPTPLFGEIPTKTPMGNKFNFMFLITKHFQNS